MESIDRSADFAGILEHGDGKSKPKRGTVNEKKYQVNRDTLTRRAVDDWMHVPEGTFSIERGEPRLEVRHLNSEPRAIDRPGRPGRVINDDMQEMTERPERNTIGVFAEAIERGSRIVEVRRGEGIDNVLIDDGEHSFTVRQFDEFLNDLLQSDEEYRANRYRDYIMQEGFNNLARREVMDAMVDYYDRPVRANENAPGEPRMTMYTGGITEYIPVSSTMPQDRPSRVDFNVNPLVPSPSHALYMTRGD